MWISLGICCDQDRRVCVIPVYTYFPVSTVHFNMGQMQLPPEERCSILVFAFQMHFGGQLGNILLSFSFLRLQTMAEGIIPRQTQ